MIFVRRYILLVNFNCLATKHFITFNYLCFRYYSWIQRILWLLAHPLTVLVAVVLVNTYLMFPMESPKEIFFRGLDASQQAVIYSIVDSMIYGNWLFSVVTSIFIPNWLCFWCISCSNVKPKDVVAEGKKIN